MVYLFNRDDKRTRAEIGQ